MEWAKSCWVSWKRVDASLCRWTENRIGLTKNRVCCLVISDIFICKMDCNHLYYVFEVIWHINFNIWCCYDWCCSCIEDTVRTCCACNEYIFIYPYCVSCILSDKPLLFIIYIQNFITIFYIKYLIRVYAHCLFCVCCRIHERVCLLVPVPISMVIYIVDCRVDIPV